MTDPVLPEGWPRPSGYADAVSARWGRMVALSGQVGWDPVTHEFRSADFAGEVRQALLNVKTLLEASGGTILDVVRMTWYVTDRQAYLASRRALGDLWRELFGKHYPAMSVVFVSGLVEAGAKVEIEATAIIDD